MKKSSAINLTMVSTTAVLVTACGNGSDPDFRGQRPTAYCNARMLEVGVEQCDTRPQNGYVPVYVVEDDDDDRSFFWYGSSGHTYRSNIHGGYKPYRGGSYRPHSVPGYSHPSSVTTRSTPAGRVSKGGFGSIGAGRGGYGGS